MLNKVSRQIILCLLVSGMCAPASAQEKDAMPLNSVRSRNFLLTTYFSGIAGGGIDQQTQSGVWYVSPRFNPRFGYFFTRDISVGLWGETGFTLASGGVFTGGAGGGVFARFYFLNPFKYRLDNLLRHAADPSVVRPRDWFVRETLGSWIHPYLEASAGFTNYVLYQGFIVRSYWGANQMARVLLGGDLKIRKGFHLGLGIGMTVFINSPLTQPVVIDWGAGADFMFPRKKFR